MSGFFFGLFVVVLLKITLEENNEASRSVVETKMAPSRRILTVKKNKKRKRDGPQKYLTPETIKRHWWEALR